MEKLYPMHEAMRILGVSLKTLQRWDKAGKIKIVRTPGGRRRVPESEIRRLLGEKEPVSTGRVLAIYARVFSHEQKQKQTGFSICAGLVGRRQRQRFPGTCKDARDHVPLPNETRPDWHKTISGPNRASGARRNLWTSNLSILSGTG